MTTTTRGHWATGYIGEVYLPQANDCWAFFRRVQREHFGVEVPVVTVDAGDLLGIARAFRDHRERQHWAEVACPVEGDAVLMAHARHPSHVGIWIAADGGGVLHCQRAGGVVFSRLASLRASGWGRVTYYRRMP